MAMHASMMQYVMPLVLIMPQPVLGPCTGLQQHQARRKQLQTGASPQATPCGWHTPYSAVFANKACRCWHCQSILAPAADAPGGRAQPGRRRRTPWASRRGCCRSWCARSCARTRRTRRCRRWTSSGRRCRRPLRPTPTSPRAWTSSTPSCACARALPSPCPTLPWEGMQRAGSGACAVQPRAMACHRKQCAGRLCASCLGMFARSSGVLVLHCSRAHMPHLCKAELRMECWCHGSVVAICLQRGR